MEEINKKLEAIDSHFRKTETSEETRLLQRTVKLNEEVGELCEAVLCEIDPNQRDKKKEIDFASELADVAVCTLMLARSKNIDLLEEVNKKLEKVITRLEI